MLGLPLNHSQRSGNKCYINCRCFKGKLLHRGLRLVGEILCLGSILLFLVDFGCIENVVGIKSSDEFFYRMNCRFLSNGINFLQIRNIFVLNMSSLLNEKAETP